MSTSSVRIRPTDHPLRRRRRRRDQNSTCCCLVMVVFCALLALITARQPLVEGCRKLFHKETAQATNLPEFPLEIRLSQTDWFRYDLVPIEIAYVTADGSPIPNAAPQVVVRDPGGQIIATVGGMETIPLRFDVAKGVWRGHWPVPFGAQAGPQAIYTFEAEATFAPAEWAWESVEERLKHGKGKTEKQTKGKRKGDKGETSSREDEAQLATPPRSGEALCIARARFRILRRDRPNLPSGTCAVNWEPDFPATAQLVRPDGTKGDWRVMMDWAEFMGADTFWFRGAVTEAYSVSGALSLQQPWLQLNINALPEMAQEAHRRGLRFGTWAVAFETYPNKPREHVATRRWKPNYQWTQDFSRSRRVPTEEAAISLLDPYRPTHIAQFFAHAQSISGVDYVGLDYIRSGADWGGYELVDDFVRDMPVIELPPDWNTMTRTQRMGWLCDRVDGQNFTRHLDLYHQWNWYRSHRLAGLIRRIVREANLKIPLWTFTLSWWHGEQHGQDPLMLVDSGVDLHAVMLYECDSVAHYEALVDQWRNGISEEGGIPAGHLNLMPGDQVSDKSHQHLRNPAAPEEMYRRIVKAATQMIKGETAWGAFVHDISRICAPQGNRGPYPGREWALAGAAAFSSVRAAQGVQPVECRLSAPKAASVGATVTCELEIENICPTPIRNLSIQVMDTVGINRIDRETRVSLLGPHHTVIVPLQIQINGWDPSRASRYMIATQVRWPAADYGERVRADLPRLFTAMTYINAM
ncbi:MAG: hypothetical protein ACUVX8_12950 [Candidatus Zipacnadales bacterium]